MIMIKIFIIFSMILLPQVVFAAEPIMITKSDYMDKVIFDGKWTFTTEWKETSENQFSYNDGTIVYLKTAHQDNFIYILVDEIPKTGFSKYEDMTLICFDNNENRTSKANTNDYCFGVNLGSRNSFVLRGGSSLGFTSYYTKIENPAGFIAVSSISDEHDRYSNNPHPTYEFRIPIDIVGRSDDYGFYLRIYDAKTNHVYSWPEETLVDSPFEIPSPKSWGEIISPDKSLPEFPWAIMVFLLSMMSIIFLRKRFSLN